MKEIQELDLKEINDRIKELEDKKKKILDGKKRNIKKKTVIKLEKENIEKLKNLKILKEEELLVLAGMFGLKQKPLNDLKLSLEYLSFFFINKSIHFELLRQYKKSFSKYFFEK